MSKQLPLDLTDNMCDPYKHDIMHSTSLNIPSFY